MTPRCFAAWCQGREDLAKRSQDERTAAAYITAFFTKTTKRVRLEDYLIASRKKKASTPDEMLEALREFQSRGAKMRIRQVN